MTIVRRTNPSVDTQDLLAPDTRLFMPRLFVVYGAMLLEDIVAQLSVEMETLLAFNPEWKGVDSNPAESVLVTPFK